MNDNIPAYDITIKNLYIDLNGQTAVKVAVTLGYYNNKGNDSFVGDIFYMYQQTPGPESTTIIHATLGTSTWLKNNININLEKGYTLRSAITAINKALGFSSSPIFRTDIADNTSSEPLIQNTDVRHVVDELKKRFEVNITTRNGALVIYDSNTSVNTTPHEIKYLSAPPSVAGAGDQINWLNVVCPYDPSVKPGDVVVVSSTFYKTKTMVTSTNKTTKILVMTVQFHFGTVSNVNQMTISGGVLG